MDKQDWGQLAAGDQVVWGRFLTDQIPPIYAVVMKRWPNRSLAEELTQKTIFDALRGRDSYDPARGSPQAWLKKIAANNLALEARRRASQATAMNGSLALYLDRLQRQPLPDQVLEKEETAEQVRRALGQLKQKEQAALKAKYVEGVQVAVMAHRWQMTEKAVHSILYRARNSLRAKLKHIVERNGENVS